MADSKATDPLKTLNKCGISSEAHQLWERLVARGYIIEMHPHDPKQLPFAWLTLVAKFSVKKNCANDPEVESEMVTYYSEKDISIEMPFWIQFEDFLDAIDMAYHESILPAVSGRTDGVPFDQPDQKPGT